MMSSASEVVTLGECLVALIAGQAGPLPEANLFERHIAGAEANTAVGLCRLGHPSAFIGGVGDDGFGRAITRRLRGEGVEVRGLRTVPGRPTGLLVREQRQVGAAEVWYLRAGSAGSALGTDDVAGAAGTIAEARWLHLSGVTAALSVTAHAAVRDAIRCARANGTRVSLAINYRTKLWQGRDGITALRELAHSADLVFASQHEAQALACLDDLDATAATLAETLDAEVVVTLAGDGALGRTPDGDQARHAGYPVHAADPVGAGDAFAAGYLAATLRGFDLAERLATGNACGASVAAVLGDQPGLPTWPEVERIRRLDQESLR
jgi:2-dehydro-3-deoxygluconokinase